MEQFIAWLKGLYDWASLWELLKGNIKEVLVAVAVAIISACVIKVSNKLGTWVKTKIKNEEAKKTVDELQTIISDAVDLTNQTFVDNHKSKGDFDTSKQEQAMQLTLSNVMSKLTKNVSAYIKSKLNGKTVEEYLKESIEVAVNNNKEA